MIHTLGGLSIDIGEWMQTPMNLLIVPLLRLEASDSYCGSTCNSSTKKKRTRPAGVRDCNVLHKHAWCAHSKTKYCRCSV